MAWARIRIAACEASSPSKGGKGGMSQLTREDVEGLSNEQIKH